MTDTHVGITPGPGQAGIPMDVATTLMNTIGLAYPGARMGPGGWGGGFTLILSETDRGPRTKVGQRAAAKAFTPRMDPDDDETRLIGFDGENLAVATPERVSLHLAAVGMLLLDATEGASNYVEIPASHPRVGSILVTVARSEGQTPHALHTAAEGKLAAVLTIHHPDREDDPDAQCAGCLEVDPGAHALWPCPTALAAGATA